MAFLLRDIPSRDTLDRFADRYPAVDPLATEAFLRLMRAGSDCLDFLDRTLHEHDLLHGRWITMVLLMREPDRTALPSELGRKQGVSRATITGLLESLENDGYVQRLADPRDGRRLLAKLTRKGVAKLDRVMPDYYQRVAELMAAFNPEQLETLIALLRAAPFTTNQPETPTPESH